MKITYAITVCNEQFEIIRLVEMILNNKRPEDDIVVLYEQTFVMNTEMKVKDVIDEAVKNSGCSISITDFGHFVLGHGIQKENKDFASEVAAQLL